MIVVSAALSELAIVTSIHFRSGANFSIPLPIMIPLAAAPAVAIGLVAAAIARRNDERGD